MFSKPAIVSQFDSVEVAVSYTHLAAGKQASSVENKMREYSFEGIKISLVWLQQL